MPPLPGHLLGPSPHRLDIEPLRPLPLQLSETPTSCAGMICAGRRRRIQHMHRSLAALSQLHHARPKWCASATTLRTMVHVDLDETRLRLLVLVHRVPRGFERLDEDVTRFIRTTTGDGPCSTLFIHHPTRDILLLTAQSVVTGPVVASRHPATGTIAHLHRRFTSDTPAFDARRCQGLGICFLLWSQSASVSLLFLCGLACTTLRKRSPRRWRPAAMVRGEGKGSSLSPCSLRACQAAWAVRRVEVTLVRNGGACGAWASAR